MLTTSCSVFPSVTIHYSSTSPWWLSRRRYWSRSTHWLLPIHRPVPSKYMSRARCSWNLKLAPITISPSVKRFAKGKRETLEAYSRIIVTFAALSKQIDCFFAAGTMFSRTPVQLRNRQTMTIFGIALFLTQKPGSLAKLPYLFIKFHCCPTVWLEKRCNLLFSLEL